MDTKQMQSNSAQNFSQTLQRAKQRLLQMHFESNCGHIGGNLSCFEAMMTLHHRVMNPEDQFILSKGHAAGALYVTLWSLGRLSEEELRSFCRDGTALPAHPSGSGIPSLLFPTGSLGHGPCLAAGLALAAKRRKQSCRIFCLCSDGEWQEGSTWEALTFIAHHRLDNLTILIDQNGLQGFGTTQDVVSCPDLSLRLAAFGVNVRRVDGHNSEAIIEALRSHKDNVATVVLMDTVKGKGLPFANKIESHYLPMTQDEYLRAQDQLAKGMFR